jgi:hypothetical protein
MLIVVPASTLAGFSKGATPANMPVELASKIDLVIKLAELWAKVGDGMKG